MDVCDEGNIDPIRVGLPISQGADTSWRSVRRRTSPGDAHSGAGRLSSHHTAEALLAHHTVRRATDKPSRRSWANTLSAP
jgi:hypothetical protein